MLKPDPLEHTWDEHEEIQSYRITIRARRSGGPTAVVKGVDGRVREDTFMTEACIRLRVPGPKQHTDKQTAMDLRAAVEAGRLTEDACQACPKPQCRQAKAMRDPLHLHKCGVAQALAGKGQRGYMSTAVETCLQSVIAEATGQYRQQKPRGLFVEGNSYTADALYKNRKGTTTLVDCVCAFTHVRQWRRPIGANKPGWRRGADWYDSAALDGSSATKRSQYGLPVLPLTREAGYNPFGTTLLPTCKTLQDPHRYHVLDFNILDTGRLGMGARTILSELARIKRDRLGKARSKPITTQVRIWAAKFAIALANARAGGLPQYYTEIHNLRSADDLPNTFRDGVVHIREGRP